MSRIRSIHPGIWTDVEFVSLSPMARLLFIGIWTECDDQGVFVWSPLQLKMRILPGDTVDVAPLLDELEGCARIMRFEVAGKVYGAVRNFARFQRPKKPNSVHPISPQALAFAGHSSVPVRDSGDFNDSTGGSSSPPVPHQFPTSGEIHQQMEDGGWRMEENREPDGSLSPLPPIENSDADKPQNEGEETVRKPSRNPVKDAELPAWLSRDDWHRWIRYRREKRRQITTDGVAFQIDALTKLYEQGHDPASVISQSINHGWIGLFEIKPEDQHNDRNRPDQRHPDEPSNPYVRASLERQAERAAGVGGQSGGWPEDG